MVWRRGLRALFQVMRLMTHNLSHATTSGGSSLAEVGGGAALSLPTFPRCPPPTSRGRRGRGGLSLAVCCFERGDVVEQNLRACKVRVSGFRV